MSSRLTLGARHSRLEDTADLEVEPGELFAGDTEMGPAIQDKGSKKPDISMASVKGGGGSWTSLAAMKERFTSSTNGGKSTEKEDTGNMNDVFRFENGGISFKGKLIGISEMPAPKGRELCQETMLQLKADVRKRNEHKPRISINISTEGVKLHYEKSPKMHHHTVSKISYISKDQMDPRAFGYIVRTDNDGHEYYAIRTEKNAEVVMTAMSDLFQVLLDVKKRKESQTNPPPVPPTADNEEGKSTARDELTVECDVKKEVPATNNSALLDFSSPIADDSTRHQSDAFFSVDTASNAANSWRSENLSVSEKSAESVDSIQSPNNFTSLIDGNFDPFDTSFVKSALQSSGAKPISFALPVLPDPFTSGQHSPVVQSRDVVKSLEPDHSVVSNERSQSVTGGDTASFDSALGSLSSGTPSPNESASETAQMFATPTSGSANILALASLSNGYDHSFNPRAGAEKPAATVPLNPFETSSSQNPFRNDAGGLRPFLDGLPLKPSHNSTNEIVTGNTADPLADLCDLGSRKSKTPFFQETAPKPTLRDLTSKEISTLSLPAESEPTDPFALFDERNASTQLQANADPISSNAITREGATIHVLPIADLTISNKNSNGLMNESDKHEAVDDSLPKLTGPPPSSARARPRGRASNGLGKDTLLNQTRPWSDGPYTMTVNGFTEEHDSFFGSGMNVPVPALDVMANSSSRPFTNNVVGYSSAMGPFETNPLPKPPRQGTASCDTSNRFQNSSSSFSASAFDMNGSPTSVTRLAAF